MDETDRGLLEKAARAAGIELRFLNTGKGPVPFSDGPTVGEWNPLVSDGDALRLAVKLRIIVTFADGGAGPHVLAGRRLGPFSEEKMPVRMFALDEECALTRRAIVRAAAAIGAKQQ